MRNEQKLNYGVRWNKVEWAATFSADSGAGDTSASSATGSSPEGSLQVGHVHMLWKCFFGGWIFSFGAKLRL